MQPMQLPDVDGVIFEQINDDAGYFYRGRLIEKGRSQYQDYEVWDTPQFGRLFRLDGCFMTSERDEFFYHESMVHVPAIAHPGPRSALVVGGGDGGAVEELLKHACMQRVVMAELDSDVVSIAREHLSSIHNGAFDDPQLELVIGDGRKYVENCSERFDQVVLDLTDPFGPAQALYTEAFYAACRRILHPGGLLSLHMQSPVTHPRAFSRIFSSVRSAFSVVRPMLVYVPLYGTWWALAVAAESTDPLDLDEAEVERRIGARGLARGAIVLIISDGWETGDASVLGEQMARLSRLAYRIVWANPRTAAPGYQPLVAGMAAAWPHCDSVVSAHSLAALDDLLAALAADR